MRRRTSSTIATLAFTLVACASHPQHAPIAMEPIEHPAPEPPPTMPSSFDPTATAFKPTKELVSDPDTQAKVDRLAAATYQLTILDDGTQLQMPGIDYDDDGPNGYNRSSYLVYEDLISSISVDDAVALTRHENPGVRAYFALYASTHLGELGRKVLMPLLSDRTRISTVQGDRGHTETVGEYATRRLALCCRQNLPAPNTSQKQP